MEECFSVRPKVFRNSELIYSNAIAAKAETLGFEGVIAEGTPAELQASKWVRRSALGEAALA